MCVNQVGGFNCTCKPGFEPRTDDPTKCQRESSFAKNDCIVCLFSLPRVLLLSLSSSLLSAVCEPACQNYGVCVAPNTCDCPAGYPGPGCSGTVNIVEGGCVLSKCLRLVYFKSLKCVCVFVYVKKTAMCSPPCAHGGTCMRWNTCLCRPGWTGEGCHKGKTKLH